MDPNPNPNPNLIIDPSSDLPPAHAMQADANEPTRGFKLVPSHGPLEHYRGLLGYEAKWLRSLNPDEVKLLTVLASVPGEAIKLIQQLMHQGAMRTLIGYLNEANMIEYVEPEMVAFFGMISGRPGEAIMWAYTLAQMAVEEDATPDQPVSIKTVSKGKYFGIGIPSEDLLIKCWQAQKQQIILVGQNPGDDLENIKYWPHVEYF